ncbi:MAG: dihydropteroate synthase [Muribaculaceae bacterium]|nr:dihydropteroate synthase [Muribaculaceae bacterium]
MNAVSPFPIHCLTLRGQAVRIAQPWVMGIVNVTPDSFFAGSRCPVEQLVPDRVSRLVAEGVDVIDVGACSTRPGSDVVSEDEELRRLRMALPVVRGVAPHTPVSVDTFRARVALEAVEVLGADMINDISGGDLDTAMWRAMARLQVPYVLMHTRGTPATMQQHTTYNDVVADVLDDLGDKLARLRDMGVTDVVADPGFGFAKTPEQNYRLLARLSDFHRLGVPLLVGVSRKSMITRVLGVTPAEALNGTTALNTIALMNGAHFLRVHDVAPAVEVRTLVGKLRNVLFDD